MIHYGGCLSNINDVDFSISHRGIREKLPMANFNAVVRLIGGSLKILRLRCI